MSGLQGFLTDLFEDLRARRLLPVAVLLLAGLVAVPVLLSKKTEEPDVPPAQPAAAQDSNQLKGPEALARVQVDDFAKGSGSSLSAFDSSNPFSPPEKVVKAAQEQTEGDLGLSTGGGAAPVEGGGTTDTGTGTGTGEGGETPDGGAPDGDTGTGDDTETTEFTYVIDVTFWSNGRKRTFKGMEKLDMLPSAASPLLIFMGVTEGGGNAVFLVDSTLATAGEGKCKPSRDECGVLYLGPGAEQEFTNEDGDSYRLLINQIRKVKVEGANGSSASTDTAKRTASASIGSDGPRRRFVPPVLIDLVVESSIGGEDSTRADQRR